MDLKMDVYTQSLELIGMLNIQKSIIWEDEAFTAGSFSVESLISDESKALLVPENIIWIEGETAGIIEYISKESGKDGPYITAKGSTLTGILARRILWGRYDLTGTPPAIMHQLVNDCCINPTRGNAEARKIPGLVLLDAPTGGKSIRVQKTGGTLLEALEQLGETYGVAFGVRFNPAVPQMEFWTRCGQNRSINQTANDPVFYSTELDDVLSSEYSYSSQDYRNAALVAGEGEGNDRIMVVVESDVPEPPAPPEPATYTITLSVDPQGGGVASGGGTVSDGASVTVTAAPSTNYTFSGWRENGEIVSTSTTYTFSATRDRALTAAFSASAPVYTITATIDPSGGGTVTGAGQYQEGATVTLVATAGNGYDFSGWQEGGQTVSASATYTFTAAANRSLTAAFASIPAFNPAWTQVNLPISYNWADMCYANGTFVAVGSSGRIIHSDTGVSWASANLTALNKTFTHIVYGNGRYCAFDSDTTRHSTNGAGWTTDTSSANVLKGAAAWGPSGFVLLAKTSNYYYYSTNGYTQMLGGLTGITTSSCADMAYGDGKYVALRYGGNTGAYYTWGGSWTEITLPSTANWLKIVYGGEKFVAIATGSNKALWSNNAITWHESELPFSGDWNALAYGGGKYVALAKGSDKVAYSTNGESWSLTENTLPGAWNNDALEYGNGKFVVVSYGVAAYTT